MEKVVVYARVIPLLMLLLLGSLATAQSWLGAPSDPDTIPELLPTPLPDTSLDVVPADPPADSPGAAPLWPGSAASGLPTSPVAVPLRVAAVLSLTGEASVRGVSQQDALNALVRRVQRESRGRGVGIELTILDDQSAAEQALRQVDTLLQQTGDDAPHALICCTTTAASVRVLERAEDAQVPTVALAATDDLSAGRAYWSFGVVPDERRLIRVMVLDMAAQGMAALALMAPQGSLGDDAERALDTLLVPGGVRLSTSERYPLGADVLTPEALLVATSQPGSVLLWGGPDDTPLALDGLRRRGFAGPVYLNPTLSRTADELPPFVDGLSVVPPLLAADALRRDHPSYNAVRDYRNSVTEPSLAGGYAWDALTLLNNAYELGLSYGISVDNPVTMRQLIRDTLLSGAPLAGVTGRFDFEQGDHVGVTGLVVVGLEPSGYRVLR